MSKKGGRDVNKRATRRELEPDDLSFLRRGAEKGLGSDRASTLPSELMRVDAVYNFSRRAPGLMNDRSGGEFIFFDVEGRALPYLMWRRTQAHGVVPEMRSLDDVKWSPDRQNPSHAYELDFGNDATRIHPLNTLEPAEWVSSGRLVAPIGVDLLVSLGGGTPVTARELEALVDGLVAVGGDVVLAGTSANDMLASALLGRFASVHAREGFIVAQDRLESVVGVLPPGMRPHALVDVRDLGADDEDPLRVWLACDA